MATEQDVNDIDNDDDELEDRPEPEVSLPDDPNEPIEVVTDEAKQASRREKRQERRNRFEQTKQENNRLRAELEVRNRQPAYQPPQQQQIHPAAQRLRDIDERERRLHKEYEIVASRPGYDRNGQEEERYQRMAREINVERMATVASASAPQFNEQEMMRKFAWQQFTSEHNDVFAKENVKDWALAKWQQLVKGEGKADTKELAEEILDQARVRFGMKPRRGGGSAPTSADRQRYSGVPARAGSGSQGGTGKVEMGPNEKRMARIAFMGNKVNGKEMTEQQAYQHWANTVGKKLLEQKKQGG